MQAIAGDRYVIDLPPDGRPEEMLRELIAAGATIVSLNPLRETLEDVFVRRVAKWARGARAVNAARCVAVAVFRESVRDKVFYNLVLFALLLIGASILIGQLTAGQDVKIIKDLGLAATSLFGVFIAIFVGISLVSKEVDRRSVYPLLAKPMRRAEFIVGKYARPAADAARQHRRDDGRALRRALLPRARRPEPIQRAWDAPALDPALLKAIALIYLNLAVVTAVALFFSTYSSPMLSAIFTLGVYVVGPVQRATSSTSIASSIRRPRSPIARACYYVLPDFSRFDVKLAVVHGMPVSGAYVAATAALRGALHRRRCSFGAIVIFSRRDFK